MSRIPDHGGARLRLALLLAVLVAFALGSAGPAAAASSTVIDFEKVTEGDAISSQYAADQVFFGTPESLQLPPAPYECAHAFAVRPALHGQSADIACGGVQPEVGIQPNHRYGVAFAFLSAARRSVEFTLSSRVTNQTDPLTATVTVYGYFNIELERRSVDLPPGGGFVTVHLTRPGPQIYAVVISGKLGDNQLKSVFMDDLIASNDDVPSPLPELRADWPLDDTNAPATWNTQDVSGNALDAVAYRTPTVPGRFGSALHLSKAGGEFAWIGARSPLLEPEQLTAIAWVRADGSPGPSRDVLAMGSGADCRPAAYAMYTSFAGATDEGGLEFYVTRNGQSYAAPGVRPGDIWDGAWHLVAGTFDGSTARFYLDGIEVGHGTPVPGPITYDQPYRYFTIGSYGRPHEDACGLNTWFIGDMDEVRVYGRALSADEIGNLAGVPGGTAPVLGAPNPTDTTPPQTSIALDPAAATLPGVGYVDRVGVRVSAVDDFAPASVILTRCVVDPPAPPASFDAMPAGCPFTGDGTALTSPGIHTIYAASRDAVHNSEAPVSRSFRIVPSPTTNITSAPPDPSWSSTPSFSFVASIPGSRFECQIDGGPWTACVSPFLAAPLDSGHHAFEVRATSPEGAVQAAPTVQPFTIATPVTRTANCVVKPVRHWLLTSFGGGPPAWGCMLGDVTPAACADGVKCVSLPQICPRDADCTIVTKGEWSDNDRGAIQGVQVFASVGPPPLGDPTSSGGLTRAPEREAACFTSAIQDSCSTATYVTVLGDHQFLYGACKWLPQIFGGFAGAILGAPENRALTCSISVSIHRTLTLVPVVFNADVGVSLPGPGTLAATWAVGAAGGQLSLTAVSAGRRQAARPRAPAPAIAAIHLAVQQGGPLTLTPRLNPAAKKLLARAGSLKTRLRLTFTPTGGKAVTSTRMLVLRRPVKPAATCLPGKAKQLSRQALKDRLRSRKAPATCTKRR